MAIDPFVDSPYRYSLRPDQIPTGVDDSFDDFLYAEPPDEDDLNYGWNGTLEFDEYPLEIQCSSCFVYAVDQLLIAEMLTLSEKNSDTD